MWTGLAAEAAYGKPGKAGNATPFAPADRAGGGGHRFLEMTMGRMVMDEFVQGRGRGPPEEFFVVGAAGGFSLVTAETAAEVMRQVARRFPPRWIGFVDLDGSRVRLRTAAIGFVAESTALQRERARAFIRARQEEESDLRPEEEEP